MSFQRVPSSFYYQQCILRYPIRWLLESAVAEGCITANFDSVLFDYFLTLSEVENWLQQDKSSGDIIISHNPILPVFQHTLYLCSTPEENVAKKGVILAQEESYASYIPAKIDSNVKLGPVVGAYTSICLPNGVYNLSDEAVEHISVAEQLVKENKGEFLGFSEYLWELGYNNRDFFVELDLFRNGKRLRKEELTGSKSYAGVIVTGAERLDSAWITNAICSAQAVDYRTQKRYGDKLTNLMK